MVEIQTKSKGAELTSIKFNGEEKLHDGINFWNRHAPVLFPIVGRLKDNKTLIENNIYEMTQHGFARDMEFEKLGENQYVLRYNEETLKKYPYKFELYISYEIEENKVYTKYKVKNIDDKKIYFGLGGHPAFVCDYGTGEYNLEFSEIENNIKFYQLNEGLLKIEEEDKEKFINGSIIKLSSNMFDNDAIIMKDLKSNVVSLKRNGEKILDFNFKGFPYLAIWSKPGSNFLCIEPWFNTTDKINSDGIFKNKENIIVLDIDSEFVSEYSVEFFK